MKLTDYDAVLFGLDGVLVDTAAVRHRAWYATFEDFIDRFPKRHGPITPYSSRDYRHYLNNQPSLIGIATFLDSRGIALPAGEAPDNMYAFTHHGIANLHNHILRRFVEANTPHASGGAAALLTHLERKRVPVGVVTGTGNSELMLRSARLRGKVAVLLDDVAATLLDISCPPAPAAYLCAASQLDAHPRRTLVVDATTAGVRAAADGGFVVVGVTAGATRDAMAHYCTRVIRNISELLLRDNTCAGDPSG